MGAMSKHKQIQHNTRGARLVNIQVHIA